MLRATSEEVLNQVQTYVDSRRAGDLAPATLLSLQSGGNDFLTTEFLLTVATAPPGQSEIVDSLVNQISENLVNSVLLLRSVDRRAPLVLWTIPDVTQIPYIFSLGLDAESLSNVRAHIERVNRLIRVLGWLPRIATLDIAAVLEQVSAEPPTIGGFTLIPPPAFGFGAAVFADPIHPTAVSNGLLANELIGTLNEKFDDSIPAYSESELAGMIEP